MRRHVTFRATLGLGIVAAFSGCGADDSGGASTAGGSAATGSGGLGLGGSALGGSALGEASGGTGGDPSPGCLAGQQLCGGVCVDVSSSVTHCGSCGTVCELASLCQAGQCVCQAGLSDCSGSCVNLLGNGDHCGTCGNACTEGQVCSNGTCQTTCSVPGQAQCDTSCVDLGTDPANCGVCGTVCTGGQICAAGQCSCAASLSLCGGGCTDTATDAMNCGGCGIACGAGQSCVASSCRGGAGGAGGTTGTGGSLETGGTAGTATGGGGALTGGSSTTGGTTTTGGSGGTGGTISETGGATGETGGTTGETGGASTGGSATGGAGGTVGRCSGGSSSGRVMECLARGVIATHQGGGDVFVSWRFFGTDPTDIAFNLYRQSAGATPVKVNSSPITGATNYQDSDADLAEATTYCVRTVIGGVEQAQDAEDCFALPASAPARSYISIPMQAAAAEAYVHLAWVGDLDGDGEYEVLVNRIGGTRPLVDAYDVDGTFLWRLDTGPNGENQDNIEGGPSTMSNGMWDGLTVFDFDSDGRAEVAIKTAPGVIFGDGAALPGSDTTQYLSILEGLTGRELTRIPMPTDYASDGPLQCQFGAGYFDGEFPSVVAKCKNRVGSGAFNLVSAAYDYRNGELSQRWKYLRGNQGGAADYHQIRIVDVDQDGQDELADGGFVVDSNGKYLYGVPGAIHGDRFHIGDLDPDRAGLEGFGIQQDNASGLLFYYYDAATGEVLRAHTGAVADMARGTAADIDPTRRGYEYWSFGGTFNVQQLTSGPIVNEPDTPWPNFRIWWDGDASSELLNQNWVGKWNYQSPGRNSYVFRTSLDGLYSWRDAVPFYGDVLGDWREEVLMESSDHSEIRIFSSTYPTDIRLYTLVHNPEYRNCLTVHGYRQSTMIDYYLGDGMTTPAQPAIRLAPRR